MAPKRSTLTFDLPEPPSLNEMLDLAKERAKVGKRYLPVVYSRKKNDYEMKCLAAARDQGIRLPRKPWARWEILGAHFRLHTPRDNSEIAAGLKWPVDFLVNYGFVVDDSPRELGPPKKWPTQEVDRKNRGLTLVVREVS